MGAEDEAAMGEASIAGAGAAVGGATLVVGAAYAGYTVATAAGADKLGVYLEDKGEELLKQYLNSGVAKTYVSAIKEDSKINSGR